MPDDSSIIPTSHPGAPAPHTLLDDLVHGESNLPPSLRILLDPAAHERVKSLAMMMAQATGFTPRHLLGNPAACHVVINMALDWRLSPHFVAKATYDVKGKIGFEGKLVQAILSQSGKFVGQPKFIYSGDWSRVLGKFDKAPARNAQQRQDGTEAQRFIAKYTDADEEGLGIVVKWQVRGEAEPRYWPDEDDPFLLKQAQPRNSTLWATDPKTQIQYLAIRRFANVAAPEILGGMAFDVDDMIDVSDQAIDVTPPSGVETVKPTSAPADPFGAGMPREDTMIMVVDASDPPREHAYADPDRVLQALDIVFKDAEAKGVDVLRATYVKNMPAFEALVAIGRRDDANILRLRVEQAGKRLAEEAAEAEAEDEPQPQAEQKSASDAGQAAPPPASPAAAAPAMKTPSPAPTALTTVEPTTAPPAATAEPAPRNRPGFWNDPDRSLLVEPPSRDGKTADWRAWRALIDPRLADCPDGNMLRTFLAYNEEFFGKYEDAAGPRDYAELDRLVMTAKSRLGIAT